MISNLTALALGIVVFAIMIGVGVVVLDKFGNATGGTANVTAQAMITELGTTSGLGSWTPAIVALAVGLLFIGALMGGKKRY